MLNKADLRRTLIAKRSAIAPELRASWNALLSSMLLEWWNRHRPETLGVYWPIRGEPDLQQAYEELAKQGTQLALPVVEEKDAPLVFASWAPGDAVVKDKHGVAIPAAITFITPDVLLIPCVGFDDGRFRLGYGGGYYDRTLAREARPQAIGIAYACMRADFEIGMHDVALDAIITERGII